MLSSAHPSIYSTVTCCFGYLEKRNKLLWYQVERRQRDESQETSSYGDHSAHYGVNTCRDFIIDLWLCWVSVAVGGFSLVGARGAALHCGARPSRCGGFSCCRAWVPGAGAAAVEARGSQNASSVAVVPGLGCFPAHGIFLDHGLGLCPRIGRQVLILCTSRQVPVGFHVEIAMMRTTHHQGFHRNEGQQEHSSIILIILLVPTETDSVLCLAPNCRRQTLKDCHLGTSAL